MALTERERKILQLNAEGLSDYQIAKKLEDRHLMFIVLEKLRLEN
jgi:DNA-binding CsgD family transcriptional regulator